MIIRGISCADTSKNDAGKHINPGYGHFVKGYREDTFNWLCKELQEQLDDGYGSFWLASPFGRDVNRIVLDNVPLTPHYIDGAPIEVVMGLTRFLESPGVVQAFLYTGGPAKVARDEKDPMGVLMEMMGHTKMLREKLPNSTLIWDGIGDSESTEVAGMTALIRCIECANGLGVGIKWGFEPNPARRVANPFTVLEPGYICGSVKNWEAKTRDSIDDVLAWGITPIITVMGSEFSSVEARMAKAEELQDMWEDDVIIVLQGVSYAQYKQVLHA